MSEFHTIVIGSGPGGTAAAQHMARRGKSVLLVSPELGGECLNYGCIPTKTYLWTAELIERLRETSTVIGLSVSQPTLDWPVLRKRKNDIVAKLSRQLEFKMKQAGVTSIAARARFASPHELIMQKLDGGSERVTGEHIIVATGSLPRLLPDFPIGGAIHTNSTIIDVEKIPSSLLVIGGGAIGVEFASLFAALGSKVTIVESQERLLTSADEAVSAELARIFARKGITVISGTQAAPDLKGRFDCILVAIGRTPYIADLDLARAGVSYEPQKVATNGNLQTNVPHIYAIGDVAGHFLLAYTAEHEGISAAEHILSGRSEPLKPEQIPMTIFSLPEVAWIGRTEEELATEKIPYIVGKSAFSANAKALIIGSRDGFVKILASPRTRELLGVHIIGEKATELIAVAAVAITNNLKIDQFAGVLHSHPILGEVFKDACADAIGS